MSSVKKAQGLPINFIVLMAIAVIILILIIMFMMGGFRTEAINSQSAANACAAKCFTKQREVASLDLSGNAKYSAYFEWDYCNYMDVNGIGDDVTCDKISPCTLSFMDKDCQIECQAEKAHCKLV